MSMSCSAIGFSFVPNRIDVQMTSNDLLSGLNDGVLKQTLH